MMSGYGGKQSLRPYYFNKLKLKTTVDRLRQSVTYFERVVNLRYFSPRAIAKSPPPNPLPKIWGGGAIEQGIFGRLRGQKLPKKHILPLLP
jgi:hypothetical protein